VRLKREIDGLAVGTDDPGADNERVRQLEDAKSQLAVARQRYSANHIDVQRLEKQVAALSVPAVPAGANSGGSASADHPDNPAYIQLNAQREAAVNERTALQRKRSDLVTHLGELEGRLASTPGVERDYMALVRDLDGAQIKYREVRQKQMEAQLAQSLEVERKGERFELIDPPVAPEEPTSPNRRLILALGSVLAVALAAGIAILLEASDHSVRSRKDITSLLSVPPLAVIPWIENDAQRAARRRQQRYALFGSLVSVVAAVSAVHVFYRPLDVLWAVAMRRLTG
jgi:uncharacterized protein involved in exopolysaccharide biosynthesis